MPIYVFHRATENGRPVFYPISLPTDGSAKAHAILNEGTVKVCRSHDNSIVWQRPVPQQPKDCPT